MENQTLLQKIRSVKYCLMAHPHNEQDSEFADRIDDLQEIEDSLEAKVEQPVRKTLDEVKKFCWGWINKNDLVETATLGLDHEDVWHLLLDYASQAKAVEPQEGWVDVKDRLPEPETTVLLWNNERNATEPYKGYLHHRGSRWFGLSGTQLFSVTHWMNLPSKPTT